MRDNGRISGVWAPSTRSRFPFGEHRPLTRECVTGRYHCLRFPGSSLTYNVQESAPCITGTASYITGAISYITVAAPDITEATSDITEAASYSNVREGYGCGYSVTRTK